MRKQNNRWRRGIAMEMAIGTLLLMVALSIILYTVAMLQIKNTQNDLDDFDAKIEEYDEKYSIDIINE